MTRSKRDPANDSMVEVPTDANPLSERLVSILPRLRRHVATRHARGSTEDIVQEALLRALQSGDSFRSSEDPWPWVRTIADRVAIRRNQRERLAPASLDEPDAELAAVAPDAQESLESARALLARLQGPERHALERYYLDGMSVAEIAEAESSPQGTIKARLSRGRGRLALLSAVTFGIAAAVMIGVSRWRRVSSSSPSTDAQGSVTLHYASFTVEDVAAYQPKFRTNDLRPATQNSWQVTVSTEGVDPSNR